MKKLIKAIIEVICFTLIILFVWNVLIVLMFLAHPITLGCAIFWGIVFTFLEYTVLSFINDGN